MSVSSGVTHQLSQQKVGDAVGVQVAKKAMDIEAQNAITLVQSAAQAAPSKSATEAHLGQNLDLMV
ncbi:MAG: YjfB family protein [Gammaproteobacteria bacterium]|nr:YjfB family protein [Gammaproteobacteria bacterium]